MLVNKNETLDKLIKKVKKDHLCKHYKEYDIEVQQMVENLYNATYRIGLYDAQIVYILDEAMQPFKKEKGFAKTFGLE